MEFRYHIDVAAAGAILASLLNWLPPVAAILAVAWYLIQIWESQTVTKFMHRRRERRLIRRRARLQSKAKWIAEELRSEEALVELSAVRAGVASPAAVHSIPDPLTPAARARIEPLP